MVSMIEINEINKKCNILYLIKTNFILIRYTTLVSRVSAIYFFLLLF